MNRATLFLISIVLSLAFAQEGTIKFQVNLDSAGLPATPPPKLVVTTNKPLNLTELSAKDTASFETYSKRRALVQDSILAMYREIENSKKKTQYQAPALEPKGEYERQTEFDARKAKWEKELGEKMLLDSKPFTDRLVELEAAKKKIESNQVSFYCFIEITTNPGAASIYLNKEEIGTSPAEYNLAQPGHTVIRIQKENYEPWDTTLTLQPAQRLKINVTLQEKSIFSKEGEIDFPKTLAKDTTVAGYRARMGRVTARIGQIDKEIKSMIENFSNTYPALEPQKPGETAQDFETRKTVWNNEGIRQVGALRYKYETYRNQLLRSLKVLEDNITATELLVIKETPLKALITLGTYDVEKEIFEITIEDTANVKTPFHFRGIAGVPRDTAKAMNRSTEGFAVGVSYINYPFVLGDSSFNLAMKEFSLTRKAVPLKVDGSFKPIGRFEAMEGYGKWRVHADSLLGGILKAQGLDLNYALKGEKAQEAAEAATSGNEGGGLGWRGWTRILTFTAAATCGTLALTNHFKAKKHSDQFNDIMKTAPAPAPGPDYGAWLEKNYDSLQYNFDKFNESKKYRDIFGSLAGVFAVAGGLTFAF
ncbi:MAG: PEGA domain-containing protein [Fibromonadales bacterium]|nr:PEGA domain-containing protein [Fibromonadales bacterium]